MVGIHTRPHTSIIKLKFVFYLFFGRIWQSRRLALDSTRAPFVENFSPENQVSKDIFCFTRETGHFSVRPACKNSGKRLTSKVI